MLQVVGTLSACTTVAVDEHRFTSAGQMWGRLASGLSQQWFVGAEGWVCTSGSKEQGGVLEVEGMDGGGQGWSDDAATYVRNVYVRGPRALALPVRREPRLSSSVVEGRALVPWTAREVRGACLNDEGQVWLRVADGDDDVWVIRRSAVEGQVRHARGATAGPLWAAV